MNRGMRAVVLGIFFTSTVGAAAPAPVQPPSTRPMVSAAKLILQLDDPDYKTRTDASLQLNNLPGSALPAVEAALREGVVSAESQLRLQRALKILKPRALDDERQAQREIWEKKALHEAFHQPGKAKATYDDSIDEALDVFRELPYEPQMNDRDPKRAKVLAAFKAAIAAGCDDPMIGCLCACTIGYPNMHRLPPPLNRPGGPVYVKFLEGPYSPAVKVMVIQRYMPCVRFEGRKQMLDMLPKLVAQMCADKDVPQWEIYVLMSQLTSAFNSHVGIHNLGPTIVQYEKSAPNLSESGIIKGFYELLYAFELRGPSNDPAPDKRQAFLDKLAEAEKTLTAGWEADPNDTRCSGEMLQVKKSQGEIGGGRQALELWFKRVTEVNPGDVFAYQSKLDYLINSSSLEEAIEFGHECLNTQNWRAGLPYLLAQIHNRYSLDHPGYFSTAAYWKDMEDVYEGCFLNFPDDAEHRNEYVMFALRAEKFDIVQQQIAILGKKSKWAFKPGPVRGKPNGATQPATRPIKNAVSGR
jgi:hypothetical protein